MKFIEEKFFRLGGKHDKLVRKLKRPLSLVMTIILDVYKRQQLGWRGRYRSASLPNGFFKQGKVPQMLREYRLDKDGMMEILREEWENR